MEKHVPGTSPLDLKLRKKAKARRDHLCLGTTGRQSARELFSRQSLPSVGNRTKPSCSWWIHPAAAYRDGVIHGSMNGITADRNGAYAIMMTDGEEIKTGRHDVIKYKALQSDPGRFKLMHGVPTRNPVRVLRTWRLKSPWAPKGGLRYDGL